jgi:hypothetical protein
MGSLIAATVFSHTADKMGSDIPNGEAVTSVSVIYTQRLDNIHYIK